MLYTRKPISNAWRFIFRFIAFIILVSLLILTFLSQQDNLNQAIAKMERGEAFLEERNLVVMEHELIEGNLAAYVLKDLNGDSNRSIEEFYYLAQMANRSEVYLDGSKYVLFFGRLSITGQGEVVEYLVPKSSYDYGGVLTFLLTAILLLLVGFERYILKFFISVGEGDYEDKLWPLAFTVLIAAGLLGIWLAVRVVTLNVKLFLLQEGFIYTPNIVFETLTYVLAANLCFTIYRTLEKDAKRPKDPAKEGTTKRDIKANESQNLVRLTTDVLARTFVIGILTLFPRYGDDVVLKTVGGFSNFVLLLTLLVTSLIAVLLVRLWGEKSNDRQGSTQTSSSSETQAT